MNNKELRKICRDYIAAQIGTVEFLSKVQLPEPQRTMVADLMKMPRAIHEHVSHANLFADERPMPKSKDEVHAYWKNLRQALATAHGAVYAYSAVQLSDQIEIWTCDNPSIVHDEYDRVFATKNHDIASSLAGLFHYDSSKWQQADERFDLEWLVVPVTYDRLDDINMVPDAELSEGHLTIPAQKKAPTPKTPEQKALDYFNKLSRRMWPNARYGGAELRKLLTIRQYPVVVVDEDIDYTFVFSDPRAASAFYEMMHGKTSSTKYGSRAEFGFSLEELEEKELVPPDSALAPVFPIAPKPKARAKAK